MRRSVLASVFLFSSAAYGFACSSNSKGSAFSSSPDSGTVTTSHPVGGDSGTLPQGDATTTNRFPTDGSSGGPDAIPPDGSVIMASTVYANTDTALYSLDPMTEVVTPVGIFTGLPDAEYEAVTDLAVNAAGQVYVNTESAVYTAALPATPSATALVPLTLVATIAAQPSTYFYALAFTPANALGAGTGEVLIGGDSDGELWSINTSSGATVDLGNFGPDASRSGNFFALSGDLVFYVDGMGNQTGLATIRSCTPSSSGKSPTCIKTSDYLAGIDMGALGTAFTTQTKSTTLLKGIYGGSSQGPGNGTGYGSLFGLGAWNGTVFAFSRNINADPNSNPPVTAVPPTLLTINASTGVGTPVAGQSWSFTDGWSGAGVTTSVTIILPPPPTVPQ